VGQQSWFFAAAKAGVAWDPGVHREILSFSDQKIGCVTVVMWRRYPINLYLPELGRFGGVVSLAEVRVQEGEPLENALRRFKRKVQQEDIIKEVKRHSFYLKPGEKRRVKEALARKRNRKKARKEQD
jgi:small subunit ribosomal protein S21